MSENAIWESTFQNEHGERWRAWIEDGALLFTGSDLDNETQTYTEGPKQKEQRNYWVVHTDNGVWILLDQAEAYWLMGCVTATARLRKTTTEGAD